VTNLLLAFHLLGAACFFAGGVAVGVLQLKAIRQERPSQVYAFLRLAPFGAALVGTGALLTLGFGIALAEHEGIGLSATWIQAALGLWIAAMALGAYGGRPARQARHLAEKLAAEGDAPSPELRALVGARRPLWASYASGLLLLAILVLMVWQPGSPTYSAVVPVSVQQQIASEHPKLAYLPTRLPAHYRFTHWEDSSAGFGMWFDPPGQTPPWRVELGYGVGPYDCASEGASMHILRVNGLNVRWSATEADQQAWRCIDGGVVDASASIPGDDSLKTPKQRQDALNLATVVAYAEPIR
jgi:uncharacterized membrane protein